MTVFRNSDPYHVPPDHVFDATTPGHVLDYTGPIYPLQIKLLGVTGFKGHGKNAVADHLVERYGWEQRAFADKLKLIARDLWDLDRSQVHGSIEQKEAIDPRWSVSPRHLLQKLGTEVARHAHPETWIRALLRQLSLDEHEDEWATQRPWGWVVTDVRFVNEADAIRKHGGRILRVVRPNFDTGVGNDHASERGVLAIHADGVIVNDGSIEDLRRNVDAFLAPA